MAVFGVVVMQFFEGEPDWARGLGIHMHDQAYALMQQAAVVAQGQPGQAMSYAAVYAVEAGEFVGEPVKASHLGLDGVVRDGLPGPDVDPDPDPPVVEWAPGQTVVAGDLRSYQGAVYRCRQGHTTQAGWQPPNVPSLWEPA